MSSGLASLAGYGSDSDDEDITPVAASSSSHAVSNTISVTASKPSSSKLGSLLPPPRSGLASKLPAPSSASIAPSTPKGSGLSLPPPASSAAKRKVIKVDTLKSAHDSDEEADSRSNTKKPKLGSSSASTSKHSLFGMLPAPKRKYDEILAERQKEAEARKAAKAIQDSDAPAMAEAPLSINQDILREASPTEGAEPVAASGSKSKGKNNDAFRAMLGLKPATPKPTPSTASAATASAAISRQQATALPSNSVSYFLPQSEPAASRKIEPATPVDFFSLSADRASNSAASSSHAPSLSISSAPIIKDAGTNASSLAADASDDAAEYPGWQLDPDGSWVPVTPEAQAQLLAYQQSLPTSSQEATSTTSTAHKGASNLDGTRDLLAAGLTPEDIRAFDASTAAREAYQNAGDDADSDKYAAAAEFAAGNRDVQQRKPGTLKGLRKGQLSSLVSLANENRGQLEEKWKRGRDARARGANMYGF
ncbi:Proline-rich protein PRCC [Kalmanozyma brasiliensis GHG001]|uniref:Proline-rich protein PRCC n=1 Tax=Kalmanozyma brasiliensis (strain GHG001) TaxID=1365824 RepID=UPI002868272E|nr:Proline-rich protein PRCC [Kalmanozyma brasiliensis GHG001]KAF6766969.1 Proline-rich protein PRCC [Kalmanozyma brasiliensis GHG001]